MIRRLGEPAGRQPSHFGGRAGTQGRQGCSVGCRALGRGSFSVRDVETSLFLGLLGYCAFPPSPSLDIAEGWSDGMGTEEDPMGQQ